MHDSHAPHPPPIEQFLPLLYRQTQEHAIMLLDPHGLVLYCNRAAEHLLGYPEAEMQGRPVSMIFTELDVKRGVPLYERQVAASVGFSEDDRWQLRKDGGLIWVTGGVSPLRDEDGKLVGFVKMLRDRTDLRTQLSTLEQRVHDLDQAVRHKDEFFARLAHEMRNALSPLKTAMAIMGQRSGEEGLADNGEDFAMAVGRRQLELLSRLARDAADLATIGAGKLVLNLERIELGALLHVVADAIRGQVIHRQQVLEVLTLPAQVWIRADADRVHQIVFNLLHNAVKYTPDGGRIWLKLSTEGHMAVIRVEDNGIGIDADLLPRIFELFTQASARQSEGGLGVGLALVRDLTEAHGGVVEVRSDGAGKGSEFAVRLPMSDPP